MAERRGTYTSSVFPPLLNATFSWSKSSLSSFFLLSSAASDVGSSPTSSGMSSQRPCSATSHALRSRSCPLE